VNRDLERKPATGKRADFCPGVHGGKNWPPIAFSPRTPIRQLTDFGDRAIVIARSVSWAGDSQHLYAASPKVRPTSCYSTA